jgi:CheY-like chemotaxis protein
LNKILLVENDEIGKTYAELIEKTLDAQVTWVNNRKSAIENVENNNIKVVILDQRLEAGELGTEVLKEILKINPFVVSILLSGQARADDVESAHKMGLFRYIDKTDIDQLPEVIIQALWKYNALVLAERTSKAKKELFSFSKGLNPFKKYRVYQLNKICINENYIFTNSWLEKLSVEAGQAIETEVDVEFNQQIIIEDKGITELVNNYSLAMENLKVKLGGGVQVMMRSERTQRSIGEIKKSAKRKLSLSLPEIPKNIKENYLVSISYQINQVFKQYADIIGVECPLCNSMEIYSIISYEPTNQIKKRQLLLYKDGETEIVESPSVSL